MVAWRIAVGIPLGFVAAVLLANLVPVFFGAHRIDLNQPSGNDAAAIGVIASILVPVYLVRNSPSVRETFRRSLPVIGVASLCLDVIALALLAGGVRADREVNADVLGYAFALLVLLNPVVCPVLYYWVVPSEDQPPPSVLPLAASDPGGRRGVYP